MASGPQGGGFQDDFEQRRREAEFEGGGTVPPKKKMSTGMRVLMILLGIGGFCMLLCCGACGLGYYWFTPKISEDPAQIETVTSEIMTIEIPEKFEPQSSAVVDNPIVSARFVSYEIAEEKGTLALVDIAVKVGDAASIEQSVRQSMQTPNNEQKNLSIDEETTREFDIRGDKVEFTFGKGTDDQGKGYRQVMGNLPKTGGVTIVTLQVEEDQYNEEEVVKMIESIK